MLASSFSFSTGSDTAEVNAVGGIQHTPGSEERGPGMVTIGFTPRSCLIKAVPSLL